MKARQLTMLNPRSPSVQAGSGSKPSITPEDIAGSLAELQNQPLKLYALCLLYAPGMAPMHKKAAFQELMIMAMVEWRKRANRVQDLIVQVGIAQAGSNRERLEQLAQELEQAEAEMWPSPLPRNNKKANYFDVFNAVSLEFQQRQHCEKCNGTGELVATEMRPVTECKRCRGSGMVRWSDCARARACGMHHVVFMRKWSTVYIKALSELSARKISGEY